MGEPAKPEGGEASARGVDGASGGGGGGAASSGGRGSRVGDLRERLQRYGLSGVLAYGLLNTLYYSCMFLFVWVYVAKVPSGLGLPGAARKFLEVFALTWGGSQVGARGSGRGGGWEGGGRGRGPHGTRALNGFARAAGTGPALGAWWERGGRAQCSRARGPVRPLQPAPRARAGPQPPPTGTPPPRRPNHATR
jgi:hypothetical protein